ncbi:MAG: hypothetical protein ACYCS4_07960 [Acidimicrobiales bacterium]
MELTAILQESTTEELRTIVGIVKRIVDRPAVVVTVAHGNAKRRYVVAVEDEGLFDGLSGVLRRESRPGACDDELDQRFGHMVAPLTSFGAQWLRRMGAVDEMYRLLSMAEVVKVERLDRRRVWGMSFQGNGRVDECR